MIKLSLIPLTGCNHLLCVLHCFCTPWSLYYVDSAEANLLFSLAAIFANVANIQIAKLKIASYVLEKIRSPIKMLPVM